MMEFALSPILYAMSEGVKSGAGFNNQPENQADNQAERQARHQPGNQPVASAYDAVPRLSFSKRMQIALISTVAAAVVRVIGVTLRPDVLGWQHIDAVHAAGRRCIYSFWHRSIFLCMWRSMDSSVIAMTSPNFDGQLLARTLERLGIGTTPGSSSRGGLRGLAILAKKLAQDHDAAWAADGPRGPRYVAKPGPVLLARRTGFPIVCSHCFAEHGHTFEKSWDRFQVPRPFSRVVVVVAPPIAVAADADAAEIERKHAELQKTLEHVRDAAESWFQLAPAERERERERWNG
jgi:lysophospholipid acyltransferase (LPLAT)-like uncharacterized protein